ncbi:MAG: hypothetical protein V4635_07100 [Bacteroidota bacterium]
MNKLKKIIWSFFFLATCVTGAKAQTETIDSLGLKTNQWIEDFNDNNNKWDVYTSQKTESKIEDGVYLIKSNIERGTVRYVAKPIIGRDFEIETQINVIDGQRSCKIGIIYGFKDYNNYNFFLVRYNKYYIGHMLNGEIKYLVNGLQFRDELISTLNTFKIRTEFEKCDYSLNGTLLITLQTPVIVGENTGYLLDGIAKVKVNWLRVVNKNIAKNDREKIIFSKPILNALCLDKRGYFVTTLIPDLIVNNLVVEANIAGELKHFKAKLVAKDSINGLALIRISDSSFSEFPPPNFKLNTLPFVQEDENQYCLQIPLLNSIQLKDCYLVKGKITSKRGFAANTSFYQISQSREDLINGAPIFSDNGECIGLYNKQRSDFDGVTYAVKFFYFKNLLDFLPEEIEFKNPDNLKTGSLEELTRSIKPSLVLIKIY